MEIIENNAETLPPVTIQFTGEEAQLLAAVAMVVDWDDRHTPHGEFLQKLFALLPGYGAFGLGCGTVTLPNPNRG